MATYLWRCPKCRTTLELRKRVSLTKRICPHCATPINTDDIDRETSLTPEQKRLREETENREKLGLPIAEKRREDIQEYLQWTRRRKN